MVSHYSVSIFALSSFPLDGVHEMYKAFSWLFKNQLYMYVKGSECKLFHQTFLKLMITLLFSHIKLTQSLERNTTLIFNAKY